MIIHTTASIYILERMAKWKSLSWEPLVILIMGKQH